MKHVAGGSDQKGRKLPPGPAGLPIIGNMHQLGKSLLHYTLWEMAKVHGPLVHLRLGFTPTLLVSSADMAREVLKSHDLAFCGRPPIAAIKKLTYGYRDLAFSPYGDYWRQIRKMCITKLLSPSRVLSMQSIREDEVGNLVRAIADSGTEPVNLSNRFFLLLNNIIARAVFGKTYIAEGECGKSPFEELVLETTSILGTFSMADFFPGMSWLNKFTGLEARMDRNFKQLDAFLEEVIESHLNDSTGIEPKQNDLVDFVLHIEKDSTAKIPLTRNHVKAILMDLFIAGTDTTSVALEWGMTELMRHPNVMKKAQAEIRGLFETKDRVEENDLEKLPYLKQVAKEILRFHPPGALLIPRLTREDCTVDGYDIAKGTLVFVNALAISRDPKHWDHPDQFCPERFADSLVDFRGQDFQFIPFGAGRRGCPGVSMAVAVLELTLANLLHKFDWEMPDGMSREMIDVEEANSSTIHKKIPLCVVAKPWNAME